MKLEEFTPQSELRVPETQIDGPKYPVYDAHAHFGKLLLGDDYASRYDTLEEVARFKSLGVKRIVNLDGFYGDDLDRMLEKTAPAGDFFRTFGSVDVTRLDEPGFESYVYKTIRDGKRKGISGLKFWKVIGLKYKDRQGRYIRPDDKRLDCIWQCAAEEKLPVLFHIADPIAFFKPVDRFNERYEELGGHPDWAFNSPGLYKYEQLMDMQYNLVASNPKTTFILAHVASSAENLAAAGKWLNELPNMNVDVAARLAELGRQPYTSGAFIEKYADRILFGTDALPHTGGMLHRCFYRYLETKDEYFPYDEKPNGRQGRWRIYGIGLSDDVLKKIYYENAERIIG